MNKSLCSSRDRLSCARSRDSRHALTLEGKALVTPFGWNIKAESEDSAHGPAAKPRPGPLGKCSSCDGELEGSRHNHKSHWQARTKTRTSSCDLQLAVNSGLPGPVTVTPRRRCGGARAGRRKLGPGGGTCGSARPRPGRAAAAGLH
jgi:hypothetical protein